MQTKNMKVRVLLLWAALLLAAHGRAQDVVAKTDELSPEVTAHYNVLKSDGKTIEGLYQAFYKKKTVVASGSYRNGKRSGSWHFFDRQGKLLQHFNYDSLAITYEAPATDSAHQFRYVLDNNFTDKDAVTPPIRIGGRYFGYLPYLALFRLPQTYVDQNLSARELSTYIELLVSPGGRLADYRVHVTSLYYGERVLDVKIAQLNEADKMFAPATLNGTAVASRIIIQCHLTGRRRLEL